MSLENNPNNNQFNNNSVDQNNGIKDNFLMAMIGQSLPAIFEKFTGQKIQMNGPEIAQSLSSIQTILPKIIDNQNKIWQKLTSLENNAQQKLVNLVNKVDKLSGLKLTHERETRQIEYNQKPANLLKDEY